MLTSPSSRVPSYRRHKPTNQAVVTINGQDVYLGKWNTAASKAEYDRLIAEFLANGRRLSDSNDRTVVELPAAYTRFGAVRDLSRVWDDIRHASRRPLFRNGSDRIFSFSVGVIEKKTTKTIPAHVHDRSEHVQNRVDGHE